MSTSVTISVHTDEDIGAKYTERRDTSWVDLTSGGCPEVTIFGPPERLRRLFTEALAAIPQPEPVAVEDVEEHPDMTVMVP